MTKTDDTLQQTITPKTPVQMGALLMVSGCVLLGAWGWIKREMSINNDRQLDRLAMLTDRVTEKMDDLKSSLIELKSTTDATSDRVESIERHQWELELRSSDRWTGKMTNVLIQRIGEMNPDLKLPDVYKIMAEHSPTVVPRKR